MVKRAKLNESVTSTPSQINHYSGCNEPMSKVIETSTLEKKEVFNSYVMQRKPVVCGGHILDKDWHGASWSNKYLSDKAGDCTVRVEWRENKDGRFGKGNEKTMKFSEFLEHIDSKDENVYLTTQELSYNSDGQPSIISPPLTSLRDDFPLVPELFSNLIVSNINMWFGSSTQHTTSGLHHDFHDNIYLLLRGEKKFTLYSPAEALNMYTVGEISYVHPNGRINYKDQPTRADGADVHADAALQAALRMERAAAKLAQAEAAAQSTTAEEAEDELDSALEAMLDAEIGSEDCDSEDDDEDDGDEYDGDESGFLNGMAGFSDEEREEEESEDGSDENGDDSARAAAAEAKKDSKGRSKRDLSAFLGLDKRKEQEPEEEEEEEDEDKNKNTATSTTPSNFSRVDTKLPESDLAEQFPLFLEARKRAVTITLRAGQMLYLPAGWFHEVESQGSGESGGHLAFNYWFHPPDGTDFDKPYTSDFWAQDFQARLVNGSI